MSVDELAFSHNRNKFLIKESNHMKIIKYIAVLAALSIGAFASAAPAPQQSEAISVQTSVKNGVISLVLKADVKSSVVSVDDIYKQMLKEALAALGEKSKQGKVVNSVMSALRASIDNWNESAKGPVVLDIHIDPEFDDSMHATIVFEAAGKTYNSVTTSEFVRANDAVTTTGNVTVKNEKGETKTSGLTLNTDANGVTTGGVAEGSVAEPTEAAKNDQALVQSPTQADAANNGGESTSADAAPDNTVVVPDNTIVVSGSK